MRGAPTLELLDESIDWQSPTLTGPIQTIGDCIFDHEERSCSLWLDAALPARDGDLASWYIPSRDEWNTKWLLLVGGTEWICCRYFAVRRSNWQVEMGRIVAMLKYPGWPSANPAESARIREEMIDLRRNPPRRPDLVVFQRDPESQAEMRELIRKHQRVQLPAWRAHQFPEESVKSCRDNAAFRQAVAGYLAAARDLT